MRHSSLPTTMHGSMHTSILVENLEKLHRIGVRVIPPRDAYGKHNLPDEATLVQEVCAAMEGASTKTTTKDPNHASRGSVQRP